MLAASKKTFFAMLVCAISGQVPEQPVVSKCGRLFEKRLILKHIEETGVCPITNEPLTKEDLVDIQVGSGIKPRPVAATSIPGLLQIFQNEWDELMLESFELKKHLDQVRQELTHALYQHDAACRVIARLVKERDDARNLLHNAEQRLAAANEAAVSAARSRPSAAASEGDAMEVDSGAGITKDRVQIMTETSVELSKNRKKRAISPELVTPEALGKFSLRSSTTLHKSNPAGILAMDLSGTDANIVVTGGMDHNVVVFNRHEQSVVQTLTGHAKKVTAVKCHPTENVFLSASHDNTARVWRKDAGSEYAFVEKTSDHRAEINALCLHPCGDFFVTASADSTWAFYDLRTVKCCSVVSSDNVDQGYTSGAFHPDGLLLALGTKDKYVRVFDMKNQSNVLSFLAHSSPVDYIAFSENGFSVATTGSNDCVKVWDLRKVAKDPNAGPVHTIPKAAHDVSSALFDFSGSYLAVTSDTLNIYQTKTWDVVASWKDHASAVTQARFGPNASYVVSVSKDRKLNVYSP